MSKIRQFFKSYEQGANNFDPDLVVSHFTDSFLGGDPNGVIAITNDVHFREAIAERAHFFRRIGFQSARVIDVEEQALDPHYTMAKVLWRMVFEKEPGRPQAFEFFITYFLVDTGGGPKVTFYISHDDERKVMRDAGLLPATADAGGVERR